MFPLFVDLTGKLVVVVGGGSVGQRKAAAAQAAGAMVRIVDPDANSPAHIRAPYSPEHLVGACLVFACATPDVNVRVVADAQDRGIWVNAASDPNAGDVFLPAIVKRGDLTFAIGTGGASPALARRIREKLEAEFDESYAEWVQLLAELRPLARAAITDPAARRALLDHFADWVWLERLRNEGIDATRAAMRARIQNSAL